MSDDERDELKPCPFCGGSAVVRGDEPSRWADCWDLFVECSDCDARGPTFVLEHHHPIPEIVRLAVDQWNVRAPAGGCEPGDDDDG
jgi:Lar family restriction alleviation protein